MGVESSMSQSAIEAYFRSVRKIIREEMVNGLSFLGEQCIVKIRDRAQSESWIDRTGNLRTSIGYAVSDHGKSVIESQFKQVLQGTEGATAGKNLLEQLVPLYSQIYALIVVAGMSYADQVEAIESKDVLASTELWAKKKIDSYVEKITKKIEKRIQGLKI